MYDHIFNQDNMIELQNLLRVNSKKITCAESCTGGLIAYMITTLS
ncbi:MAG: CinA family protein, partial [Campylobacteraceae bacterium]|nr:CinA family protein [Campylobacteraceae bacterium]